MHRLLYIILFFLLFTTCSQKRCEQKATQTTRPIDSLKSYAKPSQLKNQYLGFNSPNAINKIAAIENEYFQDYHSRGSKYYGTQWTGQSLFQAYATDSISVFEKYTQEIINRGEKPDSMHCTIYAVRALEAGFGDTFTHIKKRHQDIWKSREYAGWSMAHILSESYNWKAYLFISTQSSEYEACMNNFKKDQSYHVWKQPKIAIEKVFHMEQDRLAIDSLLKGHEFGWGFSEQGWHTWITRFGDLKECYWAGAPSAKYDQEGNAPLFLKTKFTDYRDYASHIILFPTKQELHN